MKKFLLALVVIVSFTLYALSQRSVQTNNPITNDQNTNTNNPVPTPIVDKGIYKDGEYTGPSVNVIYGNIQVKAIIKGGRIVDIVYLEFPKDKKRTVDVSDMSLPILKSEAIAVQSAEVDSVSGATDLWIGFKESLGGALASAK